MKELVDDGKTDYYFQRATGKYELKYISYVLDSSNSVLGGMISVFSLGVIPTWENRDYPLELEEYYKDELIKKYEYGYHDWTLFGWLSIPVNLIVTPFVKNMSSKTAVQPESDHVISLLQPMMDRVAFDAANDFNIEPTIVEDNKPNAPTRVEIFRGSVFSVSGNQITINFKQRAGLRPGLLVFYQDAAGKVVSTGKIGEINFTNAKASFTGTAPTKGLDVVAYREVFKN